MKINYTFHSHTFRCGHAIGDIEEYLRVALDRNFVFYGVSDHVMLPGIVHPRMRGGYAQLDDYINTFIEVKEKYKPFPLFLGFECEYQPNFMNYYAHLLNNRGFDYLICGQHMTYNSDGSICRYFSTQDTDSIEGIIRYKNDVIAAMESGLFMYIAHPDLFFYSVTKITSEIKEIVKEIVEASIKYDVPLELNLGGTRGSIDLCKKVGTLGYPNSYFWDVVSKKHAKVIIGGDYHDPSEISDADDLFVEQFANDHKLNFADPIEIYQKYREKLHKIMG